MQNAKEFLKQATTFQELCQNRGYELLLATCRFRVHKTPERFEFEEDGVTMTFEENTRHDCPDHVDITLNVTQLEQSNDDWAVYIENKKNEAAEKERIKKQNYEHRILLEKERQFEKLKMELGK